MNYSINITVIRLTNNELRLLIKCDRWHGHKGGRVANVQGEWVLINLNREVLQVSYNENY